MTLSLADSSNPGISIILINAEGLVKAEALRSPAPPIPGNEMLVAAETDDI
jgi:hypothetical protein